MWVSILFGRCLAGIYETGGQGAPTFALAGPWWLPPPPRINMAHSRQRHQLERSLYLFLQLQPTLLYASGGSAVLLLLVLGRKYGRKCRRKLRWLSGSSGLSLAMG